MINADELAGTAAPPPPSPLTDAQTRALSALLDTLIPPDEWPGGGEGGVLAFLLAEFARADGLAPRLPEYRSALDALDAEARRLCPSDFASLPPADRDALLRRLEKGGAGVPGAWGDVSPARFVRAAAEHATEGFYTSPAGMTMVGFRPMGPLGGAVK